MILNRLGEATIAELAAALEAKDIDSAALSAAYLARIERLDGPFKSVLCTNPDALDIARALDEERAAGERRGPLHGIPILVKDNLDTGDRMPTTAGSLALANTFAQHDSTVIDRLRAAGAVILGKTNLSEWANFRSTRSSTGWSGVGGQTGNAYDPSRTPGGSSSGSGVAVALGLCAAAIGTETNGSVVIPCAMNALAGIKPSIGLVSRAGIIPIAASQDTAGPMARTVQDAATLLDAITGSDARDPSTDHAERFVGTFADDLRRDALRGQRLGIVRNYMGYQDRTDAVFEAAVQTMRALGAEIVDGIELPSREDFEPYQSILLETEFKHGIAAYLATRDSNTTPRTVEDLIAFNQANATTSMPHFGQERLEGAAARGDLEHSEYCEARERLLELSRDEGIDRALADHDLAALMAPTTSPPWLTDWVLGDNRKGGCSGPAAIAGYPHVTVPMGQVAGLPVGLSLFSGRFRDRQLIDLAFAFEQATLHRRPPAVA